jgi:hypothetical protein
MVSMEAFFCLFQYKIKMSDYKEDIAVKLCMNSIVFQ